MRASGAMQDRINEHAHVDIHYNTAVDDVMGDAKGVTGLKIRKTDSGMLLLYLRHNSFVPLKEWSYLRLASLGSGRCQW